MQISRKSVTENPRVVTVGGIGVSSDLEIEVKNIEKNLEMKRKKIGSFPLS